MKSPKSNDPLHNPFYNRFDDPVSRRQDDLQAQAYTLWLKEQNRVLPPREPGTSASTETSAYSSLSGGVLGGLVVIVVLLVSAGVLLKAL